MKTIIHLALVIGCIFTALITNAGAADQIHYYHTDPAGTPLAMTDASGNVVWKADYKPFGEEHTVTGTGANDRRFVGKEKDEETGLSYFVARYMDTQSGRFAAVDPIRAVDPGSGNPNEELLLNPQRLNVYAYGMNNPYRFVDQDGRWAEALAFEGPSIVVGTHSFYNNVKQGNYIAAAVDGLGILADGAAALVPGVPGGVGLGIKVKRASDAAEAIKSGRTIADTVPKGITKVKNSAGEVFKEVHTPPSKPHGSDFHTHPPYRNVLPDGTIRTGVSGRANEMSRRDIIDAVRPGAQRTGGQ